ncbi:MAG: hypothetical protein FWE34_04295 [Defluviitaleaceae bacterium]|nr:hypothetical protein [Defluviitaleaceae bacterium]
MDNNSMRDLGLEYITNISDYGSLSAQIYEYYGASGILSNNGFSFPEPLFELSSQDMSANNNRQQFFRHLLHPDARVLLPIVDAVLYGKHRNSPIHAAGKDLGIDRESLAQIVDRAHDLARTHGVAAGLQTRALLNILILVELLS